MSASSNIALKGRSSAVWIVDARNAAGVGRGVVGVWPDLVGLVVVCSDALAVVRACEVGIGTCANYG